MVQLVLGLLARREVADHSHHPDGSAGVIAQDGSMDTNPDDTSVFADTMFLDEPCIGLAAEHLRKCAHVSLAILRISKADVALGQQFFG